MRPRLSRSLSLLLCAPVLAAAAPSPKPSIASDAPACKLLPGVRRRLRRPAAPQPSRPWSDEILYFRLVDRFARRRPTNDTGADPRPGAFHGGD